MLTGSFSFILFIYALLSMWGRATNSFGTGTGYGLDGQGSIPYFPLLHSVKTDYGAHPASYPMDIGGSFPGSKVAGACS
jgi:hypothetical protein